MSENTAPPGGSYGAPQPPSFGRSFFDSLHSQGLVRAEPRVVGGVLAGFHLRWGWDLTLVRILFALAAFFFPLLVLMYGVLWLLIPEGRDGRIHLEQLLLGRLDVAHFGAFALILLGLGNGIAFPVLTFGLSGGVFAFVVIAGLICGVACLVALVAYGAHSHTQPSSAPGAGAASSFHVPGVPMTSSHDSSSPVQGSSAQEPTQSIPVDSAATTPPVPSVPPVPAPEPLSSTTPDCPLQQPPAPPQPSVAPQPWTQQPPTVQPTLAAPAGPPPSAQAGTTMYAHVPPRPGFAPQSVPQTWRPPTRPRTLPRWVNLLVFGLLTITFAATLWAMLYLAADTAGAASFLLYGAGTCLLLVAIPLGIAALQDRAAYVLLALSIIGVFFALPVGMVGTAVIHERPNPPVVSSAPNVHVFDASNVELGTVFDDAQWDLSTLPSGDTTTFTADELLSDVTILVRKDQPVIIKIDNLVGTLSADYVDDDNAWVKEVIGLQTNSEFRSTPGNDPATVIHIRDVLGNLTIREVDEPEPAASPVTDRLASDAAQSETAPQSGATR